MTTAWAHLPNAQHIDRVLAHLSQHPARWHAARDAAKGAARDAARGAARDAASDAARGAARDAASDAAWDAAWHAARGAAWDAARGAARGAAWDAVVALLAWDDCAYLLGQTPDLLRVQINLIGDHRAVLLLPAVIAMKETQ